MEMAGTALLQLCCMLQLRQRGSRNRIPESLYFVELQQKLVYKLKNQARINISRVIVVDGRQ
jgi:hypothetical protein